MQSGFSSLLLKYCNSFNLNETAHAKRGKKIDKNTYKNMPLDSYEQSWTVRTLCTEKGNIYQYLQ